MYQNQGKAPAPIGGDRLMPFCAKEVGKKGIEREREQKERNGVKQKRSKRERERKREKQKGRERKNDRGENKKQRREEMNGGREKCRRGLYCKAMGHTETERNRETEKCHLFAPSEASCSFRALSLCAFQNKDLSYHASNSIRDTLSALFPDTSVRAILISDSGTVG